MPNLEPTEREMTNLPPLPEGAFCDTTRRIVIVSPYPAHLQELVSELMARCYDVLLFHHTKDQALPPIAPDLLIVDRSLGADGDTAIGLPDGAERLDLIGERTPAEAHPSNRPVLRWPSDLASAVRRIEELAGSDRPDEGASEAPAATAATAGSERLQFKDVEIDPKRMLVWKRGDRIELTKTEYDLLLLLLSSEGVQSRQDILTAIWGDGYFGGSNAIDVHIKSLRQKLGDDPKQPSYIATVRGVGYRLAD